MAKTAEFKINYVPHDGQIEVRQGMQESKADVFIIDGSRGWGKSLFTVCDIALPTMLSGNNKQILWVAPTYKICKAPIDDVWFGIDEETNQRFIPQICPDTGFKFWEYHKGDGEIHLFNGSKLYIRSATNPDSIVAKGYSLIIIDEGAIISKTTFEKQILPTARRNNCKIFIISSPRGKNWFYKLFLKGQDPANKSYKSFKQPWWKRPNYPKLLVELMKDLPDHIRKQEFEAEFIDDIGGTFVNIPSIFKGPEIHFESPIQEWTHKNAEQLKQKSTFVVAVDLAKKVDFTVISVFEVQTKKMVKYKRFNKMNYKIVLSEIHEIAEDFNNADIIYDATGVGSSFGDFLSQNFNVHPYVFTNQSKNELVNKLIMATEHQTIEMPNILTIRHEFEIFEFSITKTGAISYNAPEGYHDDCVMSVAMANWFIEENGGVQEIQEIDNFIEIVNEKRRGDIWDFIDNDND